MANYYGMVSTSKSEAYTRLAVDSFLKHTPLSADDEFFLIDNDATLEVRRHPAINLLRNAVPLSFAANVNQVLRMAVADNKDLVFVNNDIVFTPDWLSPLVTERAILVPMSNQHLAIRSAGWLQPTMDLEQYIGHEDDLEQLAQQVRKHEQFRGRTACFLHISFYCFRLPSQISAAVGLFDESFDRGGGEDVDYRIRAHLAGFDVRLALSSFVLHFMGKSTWRGAETAEETRTRDAQCLERFVRKWGYDLAQIFLLDGRYLEPVERLGLRPLLEANNYRDLIRVCLEERSTGTHTRPEERNDEGSPPDDDPGDAAEHQP